MSIYLKFLDGFLNVVQFWRGHRRSATVAMVSCLQAYTSRLEFHTYNNAAYNNALFLFPSAEITIYTKSYNM